jgi:anti-sigma factor RsiW
MELKCKKAKRLIDELLDQELRGKNRGRLDRHLAQCRSCAAEYESLVGATALLGNVKEIELDESLADTILASLPAKPASAIRRPLAAAAGGLILAALSLYWGITLVGSVDWISLTSGSIEVLVNGAVVIARFGVAAIRSMSAIDQLLQASSDVISYLAIRFGWGFWLLNASLLISLALYLRKRPVYLSDTYEERGV